MHFFYFHGDHEGVIITDWKLEEFFYTLASWLFYGDLSFGEADRPFGKNDIIYIKDAVTGDNAVKSAKTIPKKWPRSA